MTKRQSTASDKGDQKKSRSDDDSFEENENSFINTVPIFLKKLKKMIDETDPSICAWTEDGEMFVVKDPDRFAEDVIPQYFDHNSELILILLTDVVLFFQQFTFCILIV